MTTFRTTNSYCLMIALALTPAFSMDLSAAPFTFSETSVSRSDDDSSQKNRKRKKSKKRPKSSKKKKKGKKKAFPKGDRENLTVYNDCNF